MPLTDASRRVVVPLVFAAVIAWPAARALADEPPCIPRGAVRVDVQPDAHDRTLSRRTLEAIFSELAANATACANGGDAPAPSIVVEWLPDHHAKIRVVLQTVRKDYEIQRNLDLTGVPADGVPLAIAIAADELVIALFDRAASEAIEPPRPVTTAPPAPRAAPPPRDEVQLPRLHFGLRLGAEQLTSGLGLVGPDSTLSFVVTAHAEVVLHAGLRSPWLLGGVRQNAPNSASRFGTKVKIGTDLRRDLGVAGSIGIDAVFIADEARAVPTAGVTLWKRLGDRFLLSLDLHLGPAIAASEALLKGLEFGAGIGIDTFW